MADLTEKLVSNVDAATKAAVERLAAEDQRSVGAIVRRAVLAYPPVQAILGDGSDLGVEREKVSP